MSGMILENKQDFKKTHLRPIGNVSVMVYQMLWNKIVSPISEIYFGIKRKNKIDFVNY